VQSLACSRASVRVAGSIPFVPRPDLRRPSVVSRCASCLTEGSETGRTPIELHDRQVAAGAWWKQFMPPLLAALIAGGLAIGSQFVAVRLSHPVTTGRFVQAGNPYPDALKWRSFAMPSTTTTAVRRTQRFQ
jgi:hypothetical protein